MLLEVNRMQSLAHARNIYNFKDRLTLYESRYVFRYTQETLIISRIGYQYIKIVVF